MAQCEVDCTVVPESHEDSTMARLHFLNLTNHKNIRWRKKTGRVIYPLSLWLIGFK